MINNRQAGRRRGRGNNNGGQRQGGNPGNGSRIDNRARGNASQLHEKYKNLAADAQRAGDRVNTEYYLQFADHYFRVLSEQRGRAEEQQQRRPRNDYDLDNDGEFGGDFTAGEFGDEGEPVRAGEQGFDNRDERFERQSREDRPQREDRAPRGDRDGYRRDPGGEGRSDTRPRGDWQDRDARRDARPDTRKERRPDQPVEVAGQHAAEPPVAGESLDARAEAVIEADRPLDAPAPRRRGRPRRDAADAAPAAGETFEADRLPPPLTVAANDESPAAEKPRRRRARPADETPDAAE